MQQFQAISGQSLIDVCLNTYGSLEFLTQLALDNSVQTINDTISSGQVFNWNPNGQQITPVYSSKIFSTALSAIEGLRFFGIDTEGDLYIESEDGQVIIAG